MNEKYRHCVVWMEGNTFKHSKIHQDCQYWPVELDRFQKSIISTYMLQALLYNICTMYYICYKQLSGLCVPLIKCGPGPGHAPCVGAVTVQYRRGVTHHHNNTHHGCDLQTLLAFIFHNFSPYIITR